MQQQEASLVMHTLTNTQGDPTHIQLPHKPEQAALRKAEGGDDE